MYDTRVLPIGAAGTGAKSWVLPGGFQIAGIKIDNKSGSWLTLPDGAFVPPYTLAYGHSFQPTLSSINVLFGTGPANQVSTSQGDSPVVTIYSEPVGDSPGVPSGQGTAFIEQFTPIVTNFQQGFVITSVGLQNVVLLAAVAGKRWRVMTIDVSLGAFISVPPSNFEQSVYVDYNVETINGQNQIAIGRVSPFHPESSRAFASGIDCGLGDGLQFDAEVGWGCNTGITVTVTALQV